MGSTSNSAALVETFRNKDIYFKSREETEFRKLNSVVAI